METDDLINYINGKANEENSKHRNINGNKGKKNKKKKTKNSGNLVATDYYYIATCSLFSFWIIDD